MDLWQKKILPRLDVIVAALFCVLLLAEYVRLLPISVEAGDTAYKVREITDFRASKFSSFAIRYPGESIDPDFSFFPGHYPFVHVGPGNKRMYAFPFQYTVLLTPFFSVGGLAAVYLLTSLAAIALVMHSFWLGRNLGLTTVWNSAFISLAILGTGVWAYTSGASEHMLAATLAFAGGSILAMPLAAVSPLRAAVSGGLVGFACFLRPEGFLLGPGIAAAMVLFRDKVPSESKGSLFQRYRTPFLFALGFAVLIGLWMISNQLVDGHPLGLRGKEFDGQTESISYFSRAKSALIRRPSGGGLLVDTPAFALALLAIPFWFKLAPGIRRLFAVALGYCFIVAGSVSIGPGYQFGERFLLNAYPFLGLALILIIRDLPQRIRIAVAIVCIALSVHTGWRSMRYNAEGRKLRRYIELVHGHVAKAVSDSAIVIIRNRTFNTFFLYDLNPARSYFEAESDEQFIRLIQRLKANNLPLEVTILHSRLRGTIQAPDGQVYALPAQMIPPSIQAKDLSGDLGEVTLEIRKYRIQ